MKYEDIMEMAKNDLKLDDSRLDEESTRTTDLVIKYVRILRDEGLLLRKKDIDLKRLYKSKWEYYSGKSERPYPAKIVKSDVPMFIEADEEYGNAKLAYEMQKSKVETIESIIKSINSRNFQIRDIIEYKKFSSGVY